MENEQTLNVLVSLLKELKAYQLFLDWIKKKAGSQAGSLEKVLNDFREELSRDPDAESQLRTIAVANLQDGDKTLRQALTQALQQWTPKGRVN
jgi:hypothetical protein